MRKNYLLLISLLTLFTFLTLFALRSMDDNRLTSWQWVFDGVEAATIFFILLLGVILLIVFSKFSFPVHNPAIFLFLFSFIIAALFWRVPEVIVDASRYFTQAKHFEIHGIGYFLKEWGINIMSWTDLPLVPFLYGLIFKFLGESRIYVQVFTTSLFSMTVVLTYLIGKELWDEDTGFHGGILLLGIPYLFTQVPLMLVDVPTMFFLTLSIYTFIKGMERGGWIIVSSSVCLFLAFFSKYSTWPMLSVLIIVVLVYMTIPPPQNTLETNPHSPPFTKGGMGGLTGQGRTVFYRSSIIILIACVLIGIVFLYKFDVFSEQIRLLMTFQKPGLRRWEESFFSTFFFQIHPFITVLALVSAWAAFKKGDRKYAIISWLFVLLILFQIKRIRYSIPLFPMATLMASYGLQQIRDGGIRRFVVSCILLSSLTVTIFAYLPFTQIMSAVNLKNAGEFLDTIKEENIEVFTLPQKEPAVNPAVAVPILDLFTKKRITYHYDSTLSRRKETEKSPLRFTWEYKNPEYYAKKHSFSEGNTAIVAIASDSDEALPHYITEKIKGYHVVKSFKTYEGVFQYKTIVTVYRKAGAGP